VVAALSAAGGTISLLVGAVLLRLTVTGTYRRYVRVEMGPWLAIAGVVVVVLGLVALVRAIRHERADDAHGHEPGSDRAGWLLLAPIAALLLVAPPTLGSYGVGRAAAVDIRAGAPVFQPLSMEASPVRMTLLEFGQRAFDGEGASFDGASVRLTGFVAGPDGDGFRLARYQIACCAADAAPVVIRVIGVHGGTPPPDQWVTVTGRFEPGGGALPLLAATTVTAIVPPDEPYE
jgi:uncharacterized repeat protein (TIGR03943 family)